MLESYDSKVALRLFKAHDMIQITSKHKEKDNTNHDPQTKYEMNRWIERERKRERGLKPTAFCSI